MATTKEVFNNDEWVITSITESYYGEDVIIKAKRRIPIADTHNFLVNHNFFISYVSLRYANKLSLERYGKKVNKLLSFKKRFTWK